MSTLAQRIDAAAPKKKPTLNEWLASLDATDLKAVEDAGRSWSSHALETFIRGEGVSVSDVSLERWRSTLS